jgi:hypothetical protein
MNGFLDLAWALADGMGVEITSDLIKNLPLVLVPSGVYSVD